MILLTNGSEIGAHNFSEYPEEIKDHLNSKLKERVKSENERADFQDNLLSSYSLIEDISIAGSTVSYSFVRRTAYSQADETRETDFEGLCNIDENIYLSGCIYKKYKHT